MGELGPFYPEIDPPRKESPGEMAQRLADLVVTALRLFLHFNLSQNGRDAIATLVGEYHRWSSRK